MIGIEMFRYIGLPKFSGVVAAVPIGIGVHYYLGIDTPLNKDLGLNSSAANEPNIALRPAVNLPNSPAANNIVM